MKLNLNETEIKEYEKIFDFIENNIPDWEKVVTEGNTKIKTNQHIVQFEYVEQLLQKFNFRITDISYTDYYGIIIGIKIK
jgi:hypothetical protein